MDFFGHPAGIAGSGVVCRHFPFIFQAILTLLPVTPETLQRRDHIRPHQCGGVLLIGLGINILGIKQLRIINMLPSLVVVVLLIWIFG